MNLSISFLLPQQRVTWREHSLSPKTFERNVVEKAVQQIENVIVEDSGTNMGWLVFALVGLQSLRAVTHQQCCYAWCTEL